MLKIEYLATLDMASETTLHNHITINVAHRSEGVKGDNCQTVVINAIEVGYIS